MKGKIRENAHRRDDFLAKHNSSCASLWNVSEKGRTVSEVFGILTFHFIRHTLFFVLMR